MACLDPGNIAADIDIANTSGLSSFWILLLAHILCYFYQDASLSVAAGAKMDVATVGSKALNKSTSMTLWVMIELALIASDTQEILGAATSLQILFGLDLWIGVIVCAILTILILLVQGIHQQLFEYIFLFFLAVMGVTFWINFMRTGVTAGEIFEGFIPTFHANQMGVSMSLFGAIVMPHNLYLQSSLVMTRRIENLTPRETKRTVMFLRIETMVIMVMSFVINMAVIGSFTNMDTSSIAGDNFDFVSAGEVIKENLGTTCQVLYGIGLFSSGMSSTTTGALTGQYVMNGYCKFKINKKVRIFITRTIALVPCLLIVNFATMNSANSVMNTIQAIQLPFILIPLARYIRSKSIMNEIRFGGFKFGFILGTGILLIGLNVYNVLLPFIGMGFNNWYVWTFMPVFSLYIGFLGFLIFVEIDTRKFDKLNTMKAMRGQIEADNTEKVENNVKKVGGLLTDPLLVDETPSKDNDKGTLVKGVDVISVSQLLDNTQEKVSDHIFVFD